MVLDHSLNNLFQIQPVSALDHSLKQNDLARAASFYLLACKVEDKSPQTLKHYSERLRAFIKFICAHGFPSDTVDIRVEHIRLFLASLRDRNLSPATINAHYRALHSFFTWLVNEQLLKSNPIQNIKPPKLPNLIG